jgi:hypothetical protein
MTCYTGIFNVVTLDQEHVFPQFDQKMYIISRLVQVLLQE